MILPRAGSPLAVIPSQHMHRRPADGKSRSAAEGLAQGAAVMRRPAGPAHEGAVGPEAAVGDDAGRHSRERPEEGTAAEAVGAEPR